MASDGGRCPTSAFVFHTWVLWCVPVSIHMCVVTIHTYTCENMLRRHSAMGTSHLSTLPVFKAITINARRSYNGKQGARWHMGDSSRCHLPEDRQDNVPVKTWRKESSALRRAPTTKDLEQQEAWRPGYQLITTGYLTSRKKTGGESISSTHLYKWGKTLKK